MIAIATPHTLLLSLSQELIETFEKSKKFETEE